MHFTPEMVNNFNCNGKGDGQSTHKIVHFSTKKPSRTQDLASHQANEERKVTFQTTDGKELSAELVHLTRQVVTFEANIYTATLLSSEVLNNLRITSIDGELYFGRAVVTNIVNAGDLFICEAKLNEVDSDMAFPVQRTKSHTNIQEAYDSFLKNWQRNYQISTEFKVLVADVQSYLTGVRHWLEEMEFGLRSLSDKIGREKSILDAVAPRIIETFNGKHARFEEIIHALSPESRVAYQDFVRRQWHKLFLGSPFGHRTYSKPFGYAGDYEMMNMIHRNQPEGRSLYEKLIHLLLVSQWPAESVRNRIAHLQESLLAKLPVLPAPEK